jgi:hypothetical protein
MPLLRAAIGVLSLLALTTTLAQGSPKPAADTFVCRDVQRHGSRIKERVCGSPQQVTRFERDRAELIALISERAVPGNGGGPNGAGTVTTFE